MIRLYCSHIRSKKPKTVIRRALLGGRLRQKVSPQLVQRWGCQTNDKMTVKKEPEAEKHVSRDGREGFDDSCSESCSPAFTAYNATRLLAWRVSSRTCLFSSRAPCFEACISQQQHRFRHFHHCQAKWGRKVMAGSWFGQKAGLVHGVWGRPGLDVEAGTHLCLGYPFLADRGGLWWMMRILSFMTSSILTLVA